MTGMKSWTCANGPATFLIITAQVCWSLPGLIPGFYRAEFVSGSHSCGSQAMKAVTLVTCTVTQACSVHTWIINTCVLCLPVWSLSNIYICLMKCEKCAKKKNGIRKEANQDKVIIMTSNRCRTVTGFGGDHRWTSLHIKVTSYSTRVLVPQLQVLKDVTEWPKNLVIIPQFTFLVFTLNFVRAPGSAPQQ